MWSEMNLKLREKKRFASFTVLSVALLLSACAPTRVSESMITPSPARPMQRVVVVVNDEAYSQFFLHSSAMSYIHSLETAIQQQFEAKGIAVQTVETNQADLSNGVVQAVVKMKPTHIVRVAVTQTRSYGQSLAPNDADWMFDVQQEDLGAMTTVAGLPDTQHRHQFKSIYRVVYAVSACVQLINFPNQQQSCTEKLVRQFVADAQQHHLTN